MKKFVYVFNEDDRDSLVKAGFTLLKSDEANSLYVFANQTEFTFALTDIRTVFSDMLSF